MCGFVGIDGRIRYCDTSGVHIFDSNVKSAELQSQINEAIGGNDNNETNKIPDNYVDNSELFSGPGIGSLVVNIPFKMAFSPEYEVITTYAESPPESEKKDTSPQAK